VRLKMATLKHGMWYVDRGSGVISQLHRWEAADLEPGRHREDRRSTYHNDIFLPGLRLKSLDAMVLPRFWWRGRSLCSSTDEPLSDACG
jgi:hypothetical protein